MSLLKIILHMKRHHGGSLHEEQLSTFDCDLTGPADQLGSNMM